MREHTRARVCDRANNPMTSAARARGALRPSFHAQPFVSSQLACALETGVFPPFDAKNFDARARTQNGNDDTDNAKRQRQRQ